jgi:Zn-dependent protease
VALVCILSASYNRRTHFKKYIIAAIAAIFIVCTAIAIGSVVSAYPIWTALVYCNIFLVMGSLVCLLKRG